MPFALLVLIAMLLCAAWTLEVRRPIAAWALVLFSAMWIPANDGRIEGPTLIAIAPEHGLTVADLFGIAGLLFAAWVLIDDIPRTTPPADRTAHAFGVVIGCGAALLVAGAFAWLAG